MDKNNIPLDIQRHCNNIVIDNENKTIILYFNIEFSRKYVKKKENRLKQIYKGFNVEYRLTKKEKIAKRLKNIIDSTKLKKDHPLYKEYIKYYEECFYLLYSPDFNQDIFRLNEKWGLLPTFYKDDWEDEEWENWMDSSNWNNEKNIKKNINKLFNDTHLFNELEKKLSITENKAKQGHKIEVDEIRFNIELQNLVYKTLQDTEEYYYNSNSKNTPWKNVEKRKDYPPHFYRFRSRVIDGIEIICDKYGLRKDIYGNFILACIIGFDKPYDTFLPTSFPPTRIVYQEGKNIGEIYLEIYPDSKISEVKKYLEDNWKVVEVLKRERFYNYHLRKRKNTENFQRDITVFKLYEKIKDGKRTKKLLEDKFDIKLNENNIKKIHNRIKNRIRELTTIYTKQLLNDKLKKDLKFIFDNTKK